MPRHDNNGSRSYLVDEVRALTKIVQAAVVKVERADVSLSQLIEAEKRAGENRRTIYAKLEDVRKDFEAVRSEIAAVRAETAQVMQSAVAAQAGVERVSKAQTEQGTLLKDINDERQQVKGAATLARSVSGAGWGIVGLIVGAVLTLAGVIAAWFRSGSSPPSIGGHS